MPQDQESLALVARYLLTENHIHSHAGVSPAEAKGPVRAFRAPLGFTINNKKPENYPDVCYVYSRKKAHSSAKASSLRGHGPNLFSSQESDFVVLQKKQHPCKRHIFHQQDKALV